MAHGQRALVLAQIEPEYLTRHLTEVIEAELPGWTYALLIFSGDDIGRVSNCDNDHLLTIIRKWVALAHEGQL